MSMQNDQSRPSIARMAKLGWQCWMTANDRLPAPSMLDISPEKLWSQCLHADEHDDDQLIPSACEVDVTGVASMYALQLASLKPSALVDWNNNYGSDPDRCVLRAAMGQDLRYRISRSAPPPSWAPRLGKKTPGRLGRTNASRPNYLCTDQHRR
jgi:hypothetical protein